MARPRYPRTEERPAPLPPGKRPVGQLVAETIRLYEQRFWPALLTGIGPALAGVLRVTLRGSVRSWIFPTLGTLASAASLVVAVAIATGARPPRRVVVSAFAAAVIAFAPVLVQRLFVFPGLDLVTLAYFAVVVLAVPAALVEQLRLSAALRRGLSLARADPVHAIASLMTLFITILLSGLMLVFLLRGAGGQTQRIAAFLSLLVLSPIFLLGTGLLYSDQAARLVESPRPSTRRSDADVPDALDPDRAGRPDAEVESRPAPRGQP